jgi:hypothetical protein
VHEVSRFDAGPWAIRQIDFAELHSVARGGARAGAASPPNAGIDLAAHFLSSIGKRAGSRS